MNSKTRSGRIPSCINWETILGTFFLHVELVCPDLAAANRSLLGLDSCASATQSATPGVTTYLFYRSTAVTRRLTSIGSGQVGIEYLEVYLDDEAFWGHVQSTEWMTGFAQLTDPANRLSRHVYYAGDPSESIRRSDSWTALEAVSIDMGATVLHRPQAAANGLGYEFVSIYVDTDVSKLSSIANHPDWVTCAAFAHPRLEGVARFLGVRRPQPLSAEAMSEWRRWLSQQLTGEATLITTEPSPLVDLLQGTNLTVQATVKQHSGYAIHPILPT